ncbi:hypothetical protein JCM8097_003571 [Rhodosporidiobolus ruineniae]
MPPFAGEPSTWTHHTTFVEPGVKLHYVDVPAAASNGHTLLLIHGYPETWYCWRHVIDPFSALGYRVIAVDYRGAGDSNHPQTGFDKKTMARDLHTLIKDKLGLEKVTAIGYDIGMMVAVALGAYYPEVVEGLVLFEAPVPGTNAYDTAVSDQESAFFRLFHFFFHNAPDSFAEMLTAGKERQYIQHFYDRLSYDPTFVTPEDVDIYTKAFSKPGAMRSGFETYRAFHQDKKDLREFLDQGSKISVPVLALAGEASAFKAFMEDQCREFADDVAFQEVPHANHWIPEENPQVFVQVITVPVLATAGSESFHKEFMEDQCREFAIDVSFDIVPRANHHVPEENPGAFVKLVRKCSSLPPLR